MELEVFEENSSISKAMSVDFTIFYVSAMQQAKKLQSLIGEMSPVYQRLSRASEDRIYEFLANQVSDLQKTSEILPAIMVYQREESPREQRGKLFRWKKKWTASETALNRPTRNGSSLPHEKRNWSSSSGWALTE